jgi:hypothetical protein
MPFQRYKFCTILTPGAQVMAFARSTLNHRRSKLMGKRGPLDEFCASLHKIQLFGLKVYPTCIGILDSLRYIKLSV